MNRKVLCGFIALIVVVGLIVCSHIGPGKGTIEAAFAAESELGPIVMVATPTVKVSKNAKVVIMGCGFKPGQEVRIIVDAMDGVLSDIGYALKPTPVANTTGAWVTTWTLGRFARLIKKDVVYNLTVRDGDFKVVAHAPIAFSVKKKKKK